MRGWVGVGVGVGVSVGSGVGVWLGVMVAVGVLVGVVVGWGVAVEVGWLVATTVATASSTVGGGAAGIGCLPQATNQKVKTAVNTNQPYGIYRPFFIIQTNTFILPVQPAQLARPQSWDSGPMLAGNRAAPGLNCLVLDKHDPDRGSSLQ